MTSMAGCGMGIISSRVGCWCCPTTPGHRPVPHLFRRVRPPASNPHHRWRRRRQPRPRRARAARCRAPRLAPRRARRPPSRLRLRRPARRLVAHRGPLLPRPAPGPPWPAPAPPRTFPRRRGRRAPTRRASACPAVVGWTWGWPRPSPPPRRWCGSSAAAATGHARRHRPCGWTTPTWRRCPRWSPRSAAACAERCTRPATTPTSVSGCQPSPPARGGREEPEARGRVVIPAATLATLLGTQAVTVADTGRLTVTPGLPEALDVLDEQTLHRTRLVFDHEVDTVAALRDADPLEEPLPALLLIADAAAVHERARIAALLTQGQRLDIHGVLLGEDGRRVVAGPPVGVVGLEPFQVADLPDVVTNPAGVPVAGHRPGAGDLLGERDGLHRAGAGVPAAARVAHLPGRWQATRAPKVPSSGMRAASPRTREPRDGMVRSNGMLMIIGGPVGLVGTNQDGIRPGPRQRWVPASGAVGSASGSCAR